MTHRGRGAGALAVVVSAGLLLSACGGASEGSDAAPTGKTQTMADLKLDAAAGESGLDDAGEPKRGGKVVYGLEAESTGGFCLPSAQLAASGATEARAIYDPLTTANGEGDYVPYLAESIDHSDDYKTWTITLRDGITFHDGSPLTAEVVKNNLDAYRGVYPGRDAPLFSRAFDNIESVEVTAPDTVVVTTKVPWVAFASTLAGSRVGMMAQAQLDDAKTCSTKPIGTGPFRFDSWTPNQKLVVKRNPDYWQKAPDGKPYPYLDEIEFRPVPDVQVRLNALRAGDIDLTHTSSLERIVGPLAKMRDDGKVNLLVSQDGAEVAFIQLNHTKAPFDDIRMRKAMAMAIDLERTNKTADKGLGTIANGPFAPGSMGHLDETGHPTYDPEQAKKLVADYKADGGDPTFTLSISNDPVLRQQAQSLQQGLKKVGITMDIAVRDESSLINDAIAKQYQALFARNFAGGDPDGLRVWWYSGTTGEDGTFSPNLLNFFGTKDEEMDRLLDAGRSEPDPAKRKKIYEDLNRRMAELVVAAWTFYTPWAVAEQPDVHGILGPPLPQGGDGQATDTGADDPARSPSTNLTQGHPLLGLWTTQ